MAEATKRTALITGSTKGIGRAVADALAAEGYHVLVNGRKAEDVKKVADEIRAAYPAATVTEVPGDASTKEGTQEIITITDGIGQPLDVLVCNVGIYGTHDFFDVPEEKWLQFFQVNIMSTVRLSQYYLKKMIARDAGRLIVISSEAAFKPVPMMVHYSMTKGAQVNLARGMAELTKGTNVTVNTVLPGPTATEGVSEYFAGLARDEGKETDEVIKEYFKAHEPNSLLQRLLKPEEVANLVAYVASEKSSGTNGAALRVEGGLLRSI